MEIVTIRFKGDNFHFCDENTKNTYAGFGVGRIDHLNAFVKEQSNQGEKVFVFQGLSDVVVVRDDSLDARRSYEKQLKEITAQFPYSIFNTYCPCFRFCMKFESPQTLYTSLNGTTFLFKRRDFLLNIREFTKKPSEVLSLLEKERDENEEISNERKKTLKAALASNGIFKRYTQLVRIAAQNPQATILIDSGR
jgi:hypothetical protein